MTKRLFSFGKKLCCKEKQRYRKSIGKFSVQNMDSHLTNLLKEPVPGLFMV